jgi:hypothetical protein
MPADFYDYVRGRTDVIPTGYAEPGMRAYRYLVYLGACQMVEAHHPTLRSELGEEAWRLLMEGFVRQSTWTSHYYGDLNDEFLTYLARESA